MQHDGNAMFQDPFLYHGVIYGKGFLTTDCSTLHPFNEVILHHNNIIVAIFESF